MQNETPDRPPESALQNLLPGPDQEPTPQERIPEETTAVHVMTEQSPSPDVSPRKKAKSKPRDPNIKPRISDPQAISKVIECLKDSNFLLLRAFIDAFDFADSFVSRGEIMPRILQVLNIRTKDLTPERETIRQDLLRILRAKREGKSLGKS